MSYNRASSLERKVSGETPTYLFWGDVTKINRKGTKQVRTFVVTSDFLYNFKPGDFSRFQRRIDLNDISKLLVCLDTFSVLIVVPNEYDYRICTGSSDNNNFDDLLDAIKAAYTSKTERELHIECIDDVALKEAAHTERHIWTKRTKNQRAPSVLAESRTIAEGALLVKDAVLLPGNIGGGMTASDGEGGSTSDLYILSKLIDGSMFLVWENGVAGSEKARFVRFSPLLDRIIISSIDSTKTKSTIMWKDVGSVLEETTFSQSCFGLAGKGKRSPLCTLDAKTAQRKEVWVRALKRLLEIGAIPDVKRRADALQSVFLSRMVSSEPLTHEALFLQANRKEKLRRQSLSARLVSSISDDESEGGSNYVSSQVDLGLFFEKGASFQKKQKKLRIPQGEWDQLLDRLMYYIPPRVLEKKNTEQKNADAPKTLAHARLDSEGILIPKVFSGKDVIDAFLVGQEATSRGDAKTLANELLKRGYFEEDEEGVLSEAGGGDELGVWSEARQYRYAHGNERVDFLIDCRLQSTKGQSADGIANTFRHMVSLQKVRFVRDGFDLDLTYITRKLIAMGFPSSSIEGIYRNPMEQVKEFFERYHKGNYKIYNLCSERRYDNAHFNHQCAYWPFDDHNPCPLAMIAPFCNSVQDYMLADNLNTVAIHCKAGKGRTGLLICCFLLHCRAAKTAAEAMQLFAQRRTHNNKGVTIPSQIRYIGYYDKIINKTAPKVLQKSEWMLSKIEFGPVLVGGCSPSFLVIVNGLKVFSSSDHMKIFTYTDEPTKHTDECPVVWKNLEVFNIRFAPEDDIVFKFHELSMMGTKSKLFQCWQNARFVSDGAGKGSLKTITMEKGELDDALKDKKCARFLDTFKTRITFRQVPKSQSSETTKRKQLNRMRSQSLEATWLNEWELALEREEREDAAHSSWKATAREITRGVNSIKSSSSRLTNYINDAEKVVSDGAYANRKASNFSELSSWDGNNNARDNDLDTAKQDAYDRQRQLTAQISSLELSMKELGEYKERLQKMLTSVEVDLENMPEEEIML